MRPNESYPPHPNGEGPNGEGSSGRYPPKRGGVNWAELRTLPSSLVKHGAMLQSVMPDLLDAEVQYLEALGAFEPVQHSVKKLIGNDRFRGAIDETRRRKLEDHQAKISTIREILGQSAHLPRVSLRQNGDEPACALLGEMLCPADTGLEWAKRLGYNELAQHDVLKLWLDAVDKERMFRQVCADAELPNKADLQEYAACPTKRDREVFVSGHPPKFAPLRGLEGIKEIRAK